jgi:RND family efflux transporter MFP subunit
MKKYIFLIITLAVIGRFAFPNIDKIEEKSKISHKIPSVRTSTINPKLFFHEVILFSSTSPIRKSELYVKNTANIQSVYKKEGDFLKKGDLILELDNQHLIIKKEALKKRISHLITEYHSFKDLYSKNMASKIQYESSIANLEIEKANLKNLEKNIGDTKYYSLFDGYLQDFDIEVGDRVLQNKILGKIVDNSILEIETYISQEFINDVYLNQVVNIESNNDKYKGKISYISSSSDENTHTFKIKIIMDNHKNRASGTTAKAILSIKELNGFEISPYLLNTDENNLNKFYIKVVVDNHVEKVYVVPVQTSPKGLWVSGENLTTSYEVITVGHLFVTENQEVNYKNKEL